MSNYNPLYEITNKIINLVSSISEKVEQITYTTITDCHPYLHKTNRIKSIHSSLKIEANSLALNEVENIINGHEVIGPKKDILEVQNAYKAYEQINTVDPYSINDLLKLHGVMTKGTVKDSGKFRETGEGVFSGEKCIFIAPSPNIVPTLVDELFSWIKKNKNDIHPLILSSVFHYEFVFIHPFTDGNGRMARLWHTILLSKWKNVFEFIPIESQIEKNQNFYYKAINESNNKGNSTKFIEFSLTMIDNALDEMIVQESHQNSELSEYVKRLLEIMSIGIPYSTKALIKSLNLKSRETFRKNYMGPALKIGLVKMEIPDKPNSKNQRYIRIK